MFGRKNQPRAVRDPPRKRNRARGETPSAAGLTAVRLEPLEPRILLSVASVAEAFGTGPTLTADAVETHADVAGVLLSTDVIASPPGSVSLVVDQARRAQLLGDPDLTTAVSGVVRNTFTRGQVVTATATFTNGGRAATGPFDVQFWLSRNGVKSRYRHIETDRVVVGLAPFGTRTNHINGGLGYALPDSLPFGDYHTTAHADTAGEVAESNKSNNAGKSSTFRLAGPDLEVPTWRSRPSPSAKASTDAASFSKRSPRRFLCPSRGAPGPSGCAVGHSRLQG